LVRADNDLSKLTFRDLMRRLEQICGSKKDAELILEEVAKISRSEILINQEKRVPFGCVSKALYMAERRKSKEPLQYILGHWQFRQIDVLVDKSVLIPRPETEYLVDLALSEAKSWTKANPIIVELGCGSGVIAISLANELPEINASIIATDISKESTKLARLNYKKNKKETSNKIVFKEGNLFEALDFDIAGKVDMVISNPPYVSALELKELQDEIVLFEPLEALVAGPKGTEIIKAILLESMNWLSESGVLFVEIGETQGKFSDEIAKIAGFKNVEILKDFCDKDRYLVCRKK
jgi:release factor glutamine methyltransferase